MHSVLSIESAMKTCARFRTRNASCACMAFVTSLMRAGKKKKASSQRSPRNRSAEVCSVVSPSVCARPPVWPCRVSLPICERGRNCEGSSFCKRCFFFQGYCERGLWIYKRNVFLFSSCGLRLTSAISEQYLAQNYLFSFSRMTASLMTRIDIALVHFAVAQLFRIFNCFSPAQIEIPMLSLCSYAVLPVFYRARYSNSRGTMTNWTRWTVRVAKGSAALSSGIIYAFKNLTTLKYSFLSRQDP